MHRLITFQDNYDQKRLRTKKIEMVFNRKIA
jgi:hypothetical protein